MGIRIRKAIRTAPLRTRNVTTIANHRGIMWESQRTGKESTSATAKPPSNIIGTVGENHIIRAKTRSPRVTSTVRVRLEIRIGVGSYLPDTGRVLCVDRFLRATANLHVGRTPPGSPRPNSLADASPEAQTTLLGLSVPLPASLPRTWKDVMSIRMPNATA
jgi:hypothetical protein